MIISILYIYSSFLYFSEKILNNNLNTIKTTINKSLLEEYNFKNNILFIKTNKKKFYNTNDQSNYESTIYNNVMYDNNNVMYNNINIYYEKRIKSKKRILEKIKKLKFPYDIYGLRIIYNDTDNYYNNDFAYIIKNILYNNYYTLDFIYDDYIKYPKKNNYKSIHIYVITNIILEIQIRNYYMHNIAINGTASNYYL